MKPWGIPTTYRGRRYRSRLEARWAAFFHLLGWDVEYEPFDCKGWIPDFAIVGAKQTTLVEIKPTAAFLPDIVAKIDAADRDHDLALLGYALPEHGGCLGWLGEFSGRQDRCWGLAPFGRFGGRKIIGFCHDQMNHHDRITGNYDGNFGNGPFHKNETAALWDQAANIVQWRGK